MHDHLTSYLDSESGLVDIDCLFTFIFPMDINRHINVIIEGVSKDFEQF